MAAGASLKADALVNGKGGNVTMWSNDATAFAGNLSARGGAQGGDGGFAEVSSNKNIGLTGSADLRAPKGKTGLLLIDPTDLRIVDSASGGGSQDGAAGDGTINGGDANTANNTVSRGLLESLAGTTNIKLEATGQITVADMAAINLKTTAGHSFTMRSTQTGGIRFENSNTEISTQGGSITLEALGVGSTLDNIGKLTSRGGAITLNATGDINRQRHQCRQRRGADPHQRRLDSQHRRRQPGSGRQQRQAGRQRRQHRRPPPRSIPRRRSCRWRPAATWRWPTVRP